jgi:aspartate aminotransferase-like enzyme
LGNLRKAPESLFAKKSYDTPVIEGAATIEMDYILDSKLLKVDSKFVSKNGVFSKC